MATLKTPYLIAKRNKGGAPGVPGDPARGKVRFYWQPSPKIRDLGFAIQRLSDDEHLAHGEAAQWNAKVAAVLADTADPARGEGAGRTGGPGAVKNGSVDALIGDYKLSRFYLGRRAKTRAGYNHNLKILSAWAGDKQVSAISAYNCNRFYEQLAEGTPSKAAAVMRVGRLLFACAPRLYKPGDAGYLRAADNPFRELRVARPVSVPLIWPAEAVDLFVKTADRMDFASVGDAVAVNFWLGQRQGDVLTLPKSIYRDGVLRVTQSKRGAKVDLPVDMVAAVKARIEAALARNKDATIQATTIIVCELTGKPWNQSTFQHTVAEIRAAAAKEMPAIRQPHLDGMVPFRRLQFMHLRHTAVVRLAEAGCTIPEIAAITGHSPRTVDEILAIYLVPTGEMARAAFAKRIEKEQGE